MIPNIRKGAYMAKLLYYLAGPGRENEHVNQRVVAGDPVTMAVYGGAIDQVRAVELARLLDSPRQTLLRGAPVSVVDRGKARGLMAEGMDRAAALEAATSDHNTWHCSLTLHPTEPALADGKWQRVAEDFMTEMGFIGRADGIPDVRWSAIHHGPNKGGGDHIHIAMGVVRPDGGLANLYMDYRRAQAVCRELERRHGLRELGGPGCGAERATKPGERARRDRTAAPETEREALQRRVRAIAAGVESEAEWVREMRAAGLVVRPYFAKGGMDQVSGYSVGMRPSLNAEGKREKPLSYGGGRLARDLTLTALRSWAPWAQGFDAEQAALDEWRKANAPGARSSIATPVDEQATIAELQRFSDYARGIAPGDRDAWAKLASQSSGMFAALSVQTETKPGPLDRLARQLARAADRPAHQRRPAPVHPPAMRAAARMLWSITSPTAGNMAVLYALIDCLNAVRDMLEATDQARAAQAMLSVARKAVTEIHMRADGLDPARPYTRTTGSPAWVAAYKASIVVDGENIDDYAPDIATASAAWNAHRIAAITSPGGPGYDARGYLPQEPKKPSPKPAPQKRAPQKAVQFDLARFMELQRAKPRDPESDPLADFEDEPLAGSGSTSETSTPPSPAPDADRHRLPPHLDPTRRRDRGRGGFER